MKMKYRNNGTRYRGHCTYGLWTLDVHDVGYVYSSVGRGTGNGHAERLTIDRSVEPGVLFAAAASITENTDRLSRCGGGGGGARAVLDL